MGRSAVVHRVEAGETFAQAAACAGVSKSTLWTWVERWNAATPEQRASLACLEDRSGRPRSSPSQVPAGEAARICELRERTAWSPQTSRDEPGSPGPTRRSIRSCTAAAAPSCPPRSARLSCATGGRAQGICCTWTSRSSGSSQDTPSRGTAPGSRRVGRE
ncbi:MAG: helix-turn-helix domain-containing protein [Actinobacteria bacterium]|nr:helix-turn-helix domain-containing protein [Actinomycetota bacterium]